MRQTNLLQQANPQKPNTRVTRGNSDLPKQQPKEISLQSSESQEQSINQSSSPKEKKIHHMTLKALERKKKMIELGIQNVKSNEGQSSKIPRKRGRPKGTVTKKKVEKQDFQIHINEVIEQNSETPKKKQLRKRENMKKIIDPDSEQIMISEDIELPNKDQKVKVQQVIKLQPASIAVNNPKKRGRKKKVQIQFTIQNDNNQSNAPAQPTQKLFTIPKLQTYDNYNKFYNQILEQTKQLTHKQQQILIFDKFTSKQAYQKLLNNLQ